MALDCTADHFGNSTEADFTGHERLDSDLISSIHDRPQSSAALGNFISECQSGEAIEVRGLEIEAEFAGPVHSAADSGATFGISEGVLNGCAHVRGRKLRD